MMKENYHAEGKGRSPQTFPRRAVLQAGGGVVGAAAIERFSMSTSIAAEPTSQKLPNKYKELVGVKVVERFQDSVTVVEVEMPVLEADDILVRNTIAAVSAADIANTPRNSDPERQHWEIGVESVGEIVAVGSAVADRKVGERVFIYTRRDGAYAEYRLVKSED